MHSFFRRLRDLIRQPLRAVTASEPLVVSTPPEALLPPDEAYVLAVGATTASTRRTFLPEMVEPISTVVVDAEPVSPGPSEIISTVDEVRSLDGAQTTHSVDICVETIALHFDEFTAWLGQCEKVSPPLFDYTTSNLSKQPLEFLPSIAPQLERNRVAIDGKAPRRNRIRSVIGKISERYSLTPQSMARLYAVFGKVKSHKTLKSVSTLLAAGHSVDEIISAHTIRVAWRANECFQQGSREYAHLEHFNNGRRILLCWRSAIILTELFGRCADFDEIELGLARYFSIWNRLSASQQFDETFFGFLLNQAREFRPQDHHYPLDFILEGYNYLRISEEDDDDAVNRELSRLGLLPDIWTDPFDERVAIDPDFSLLEDCLPKLELEPEEIA
jgi:hypothetical protein